MTGRTYIAALFLSVTVAVAGAAVWGIWIVTQAMEEQLVELVNEAPSDLDVVVAAREIPAGHTIVPDDLKLAPMRKEYVPPEAITRPDLLVGRVAAERILQADLIRDERLAKPESGTGLNAIIPAGMRALSFNISGADQVSGFVQPGNRVDILATLFHDEGELIETTTLLQGVGVLAVDDRTQAGRSSLGPKIKPQVTVAVAPDDAERITHVFKTGVVRLSLRGDTDLSWFGSRGTLTTDLLGGEHGEAISIRQWYARAGLQAPEPRTTIIHGPEAVVEGG